MFYKRFKFVKDFTYNGKTVPKGSEITIMEGRVWFNNGLVQQSFADLFSDLVEYESIKGWEYLREMPIPYNKA